jgi:Glycosyl transferase family 2
MPSWGLVATVKAPEEQVLAFIAHHLSLGCDWIWIFFDDPEDPTHDRVASLPRVTATRCTDVYWVMRGGRHSRHQNRQLRNAREAQKACKLDWLGHIDVDEFLHAPKPVAEVLANMPPEATNLMMEPFEAMHDASLADDIFTARHFRGPLHRQHRDLQPAIFGPAAAILPKGSLGHTIGKSFCRPSVKGISLRLHSVFLNKERLHTPFHPSLRILHFHAHDPVAWAGSLPFRLASGAYSFAADQALKDHLTGANDTKIRAFYDAVQTLTPEKIALLQAHDRLITTDLDLRAKVDQLLAGTL